VVVNINGQEVTSQFVAGARAALATARSAGAAVAVLKETSPSCGCDWIHDGTFSGHRIRGRGVTAALLAQSGIRTFSEQETDLAAEFLASIETV
jgi:uncharacterized protein YbbK (DUF523 family)